ncbi:pyrophosphate-dependent phosphofructokinase [Fluviicoccus keumensis]|uniref:Pyrophosphate--fructose 6-phosphate 1-phosphotransferase n=1 Tax=Fluviicoccus keumensis TaxID=1435465 RepID=A0A4Q7ZCV8_9GAMM|nr:pyrophosphate-dependent phosphofructokinase [Fluviicoccus keumensis]
MGGDDAISVIFQSSPPPGVGYSRNPVVTQNCNALYAQAGGVTAVINSTAAGLIAAWRQQAPAGARLFGARDGIVGLLEERLVDLSALHEPELDMLGYSPSAALGTCRHVLQPEEHARLVAVLQRHRIGTVFYNGGGGAARACGDILAIAQAAGYPLNVVHVPKTIDNDIPDTDACPGFGSAAKYLATSLREASLDLAAMAGSSSKVFILETMGRYSGWLTAACGLAARHPGEGPHILLLPERPFDEERFLRRVRETVDRYGHCAVAASEGLTGANGELLHATGQRDAAGDRQLGGVAPWLAARVTARLGYKCHWSVADYLQRSARHLVSATDVAQARATGQAAVMIALAGERHFSPVIRRLADDPYRWDIVAAPLAVVTAPERRVPADFLTADGYQLSAAGRRYLAPLIVGEDYPPFRDGLPDYRIPAFTDISLSP